MPKLLVTLPDAREITHDLTAPEILIGRTPDNTIQIDEASVSLRHARLTLEKRGYRLQDLDSTNRTWINGVPVAEAVLTERCLVRFGRTECFFLPDSSAESEGRHQWDLTEAARLKTECAELRSKRDELQHEVAALTGKLKGPAIGKKAAEKKQNATERELKNLREQLESTTAERAKECTRLEQLLKDLEAVRKRNVELLGELDEQKVQHASSAATQGAHEELKERHARSEKEREELELDFTVLKLRHAELDAELAAERAHQSQAHAESRELSGRNEVLQKATHDLETRLRAAEAQRDQLRIAYEQLSQGITAAQDEMQLLTARWTEVMARLPHVAKPEHADDKAGTTEPKLGARTQPLHHPEGSSARANGSEAASQREAEVLQTQIGRGSAEPEGLGAGLRAMSAATDRLRQHPHDRATLHELFGFSRGLAQHADARGEYAAVRCMASTLEALLGDLCKLPEQFDAAKLLTLTHAVETLRILVERDHFSAPRDSFRAKMCVIGDGDEDPMIAATRLVDLDLSTINYPTAKIDAVADQDCELIVLDPGHHEPGRLDYSTRLRAFPRHKKTPVIIVIPPDEVPEGLVPPAFTGSEDYIVKPFNTFEMAVKILTGIFMHRLDRANALM